MYKLFFKRFFDFILSLLAIVILSPILLIISIFIKLGSKGPIFFLQERVGLNQKVFKIIKFRTMVVNAEHIGDGLKVKENDDPRITKAGKILRKTSLDELPQLFNILKGDMSFIGPRPWITDYSHFFTTKQMRRLDERPGLTGLAQCNGRNNISIVEKINYDIYYVENISLLLDIKIFIKTIKSVFTKNGAVSSKFAIKSELEELMLQPRYVEIKQENIYPRLNTYLKRI